MKKKNEIISHLDHIISNIKDDIIKKDIISLKESIISKEIIDLDYNKVKQLSNEIYDLNMNNDFSLETDYISNEFYAIEFLLEELLNKIKAR